MLSLRKCREALTGATGISDQELEVLRDQLYALASIVVACHAEDGKAPQGGLADHADQPEGGSQNPAAGFEDAALLLSWDERVEVEERAAILQYDGGFPRDEAEKRAVTDLCKRKAQGGQR